MLVKYIDHISMYGIFSRNLGEKVITEDITKVKKVKHIVIHLVYAICTPNPNSSFTPESTVLYITFLNKSPNHKQIIIYYMLKVILL